MAKCERCDRVNAYAYTDGYICDSCQLDTLRAENARLAGRVRELEDAMRDFHETLSGGASYADEAGILGTIDRLLLAGESGQPIPSKKSFDIKLTIDKVERGKPVIVLSGK